MTVDDLKLIIGEQKIENELLKSNIRTLNDQIKQLSAHIQLLEKEQQKPPRKRTAKRGNNK